MADAGSISAMIGAFIAVAILIGLGPQILGNTVMDCSNLPGWTGSSTNATDWALTCVNGNASTQQAYALLIIVLVVIAAVVILFVVRML